LISLHGLAEKKAFQRSAGVSCPEKLNSFFLASKLADLVEKARSGITEDHLGLIFDGDEIFERALLHESPLMYDADSVTNFLNLLKQVRAEEDSEAPVL